MLVSHIKFADRWLRKVCCEGRVFECAIQVLGEGNGVLTAKCLKGHKISLCCLSLQPCQDFSTRKCEICNASALSLSTLSDSHVVKGKLMCSLCGGRLRDTSLLSKC
ncbi:hypothetical protein PoB_001725900 [Plakobranchus ocellatus]|uniref:Uncharacterized protein n=1 Tax=Plakobranchus ocellatus TaxID=259542 RepID=A0AAV3Z8K7_9GAST|nr:hypothetical protein PoB_001725900 [Plakobranchus ocellatus]